MKFHCRLTLILCLVSALLSAEVVSPSANQTAASGAPSTENKTEPASIEGSFRALSLGMSLDEVKAALIADSLFGYRGERDVSLLAGENRTLIETTGYSFIKRAWFQFLDETLFVMTLSLDPEKIDYFSVYSQLVTRFGEPSLLDPHKAQWTGESVTLSLERPLTVKYLDTVVFAKIVESSQAGVSATDMLRKDFLNEF